MRAIRSLTNLITERMQALLIQTANKEEERLLRPVERAIQNDRPLSVGKHHYRTQRILRALRDMPEETREALREQATAYDEMKREAGQLDIEFSDNPERRIRLGTVLALPLFVYGLVNHALWLGLVRLLWNKLGIDRGYKATVQSLASWFIIPITYFIQLVFFRMIYPDGWGLLYLLSLPVFGLFALKYWVTYRSFWSGRTTGRSDQDEQLRRLRGRMLALVPEY